jgi:hypothetical protein
MNVTRAVAPPTIFTLLWSSVEPAARQLPLAQPPGENAGVDTPRLVQYSQRGDAAEYHTRVRLCAWNGAKTAVEVATAFEKAHRRGRVDAMQLTEQGQR